MDAPSLYRCTELAGDTDRHNQECSLVTRKMIVKIRAWWFLGMSLLMAFPYSAGAGDTIRIGHFPNITHVQGLVAQHLSRTGRGWFEE